MTTENMTKKLDLIANEILGARMTESEVIDKSICFDCSSIMMRNKR